MSGKLSVIIPVYNERTMIEQVIANVLSVPVEKEIILVDDGSVDGTRELIQERFSNDGRVRVILHPHNQGKGSAVRTGIGAATGGRIIIQDADLEYNPADYFELLKTMDRSGARVVYGSRFLNKKGVTSGWHRAVNYFLTALCNGLFASKLTDMETCYKLFDTNTLKRIKLDSDGFEIEAELTVKVLKSGEKIVEAPVSYKGRSYHEGKKIGWKDGVKTMFLLFRYALQK